MTSYQLLKAFETAFPRYEKVQKTVSRQYQKGCKAADWVSKAKIDAMITQPHCLKKK